jgi:hypothetical protein
LVASPRGGPRPRRSSVVASSEKWVKKVEGAVPGFTEGLITTRGTQQLGYFDVSAWLLSAHVSPLLSSSPAPSSQVTKMAVFPDLYSAVAVMREIQSVSH